MTAVRRCASAIAIVVALLPSAAASLASAQPSFDCAKATGSVEKLVCADESLAALDRKLDDMYRAARARTKGPVRQDLVATQRGWVSGRSECRKAQDVRRCVESSYGDRIVELQATYDLVPARGPFTFTCDDPPATRVAVRFFETDPPSARMDFSRPFAKVDEPAKGLIATLAPSGSGARYVGRRFEFWNKGREALLDRQGEPPARCTSKP